MAHLLRLMLKRALPGASYPFSVPAVRALEPLDVHVGVAFFVGENGSGKSTLLEGIAAAAELKTLGSDDVTVDDTLAPARLLASVLRLAWTVRTHKGFFMRAEDFFGYHKGEARTDARICRELAERDVPIEARPPLATAARHTDEEAAARFIARRDVRSHGESFMDIFEQRVHAGGLYLLDEPEGPLSPARQIRLVKLVARAAERGAQFIIATHSPILLACPGARIYSFDDAPITRVAYADVAHVKLTRAFLNDPKQFLDADNGDGEGDGEQNGGSDRASPPRRGRR